MKTVIDKNEAIEYAIKTIKLLLEHKPVRNIDETISYLEQAKSQQNTLNRDKVIKLTNQFANDLDTSKFYGKPSASKLISNFINALCSLSLPTLSEPIYRKVKNPKYQAYKNCKHEKQLPYHDESIICEDCHCILSQHGVEIDNPKPIGGHYESEYYFEEVQVISLNVGNIEENIIKFQNGYNPRVKLYDYLIDLGIFSTKSRANKEIKIFKSVLSKLKLEILPNDFEVKKWFEENINEKCSASSAIYKFRLWLEDIFTGKLTKSREE
jgi:hypothetical protein